MITLTPEIYPEPNGFDGFSVCPDCSGPSTLHFNPHRPEITPYWVCPYHGIVGDAPEFKVVYVARIEQPPVYTVFPSNVTSGTGFWVNSSEWKVTAVPGLPMPSTAFVGNDGMWWVPLTTWGVDVANGE